MREVRDPVHGFIYRTPLEEDIIDTPLMQRLGRIKQLAMASLVYPGVYCDKQFEKTYAKKVRRNY